MASASRLILPKLASPPATILEYLIARFPQIADSVWRQRADRGLLTLSSGVTLGEGDPYRTGLTVFYYKEVENEPPAEESETILYRNDNILVADKPHGMPVTPAGAYVDRSLLVRLQQRTGIEALAPAHRLDRETAGIVLFTLRPEVRRNYAGLFATKQIQREYLAVAQGDFNNIDPLQRTWRVETRLAPGQPWFRQKIVEGPPHAFTSIELLGVQSGWGLFRLMPGSGRKHQLRVHMASIGFPIVGDPLYPDIQELGPGAPPLQLLARRLEFVDPVCGEARRFVSARELACWPPSLPFR